MNNRLNLLSLPATLLIVLLCLNIAHAQQSSRWLTADTTARYYISDALAASADGNDLALISMGLGITPTVLRSTDGGKTWVAKRTIDTGDFAATSRWTSVAHPTPESIVIVGDSSLFLEYDPNFNAYMKYWGIIDMSSDGGETWTRMTMDSNSRLLSISMSDASHGIIFKQSIGNLYDSTGYYVADSIIITDDGWKSHRAAALSPGITYALQVVCLSPTSYCIFAYDNILRIYLMLRTDDGGLTWKSSEGLPTGVRRFQFIDGSNGWGVGSVSTGIGATQRDVVTRTTDGGFTWTKLLDSATGKLNFGLSNISFLDQDNGIAVGGGNKILRTRDGGKTWTQETPPPEVPASGGIGWVTYLHTNRAVAISGFGPIIYWDGETILATPRFIKPTGNDAKPLNDILIQWTPIDGATRYRVQVAPDPVDNMFYDPDIYDKHIVDTTLAATSLLLRKEQLLYWHRYWVRVMAINDAQQSDWSRDEGSSLFYTMKQGSVLPPKITYPPHGATDQPLSLTIQWESLSGATSYDLDIGTDPYFAFDPPMTHTDIAGTSLAVSGLKLNTEYFVRLRAHVGSTLSDWTSQYAPHIFHTVGFSDVPTTSHADELTIVPNPATTIVRVKVSSSLTNTYVELFNAIGQRVRRMSIDRGAEEFELSLADLPEGCYLLRLSNGATMQVRSLIIAR